MEPTLKCLKDVTAGLQSLIEDITEDLPSKLFDLVARRDTLTPDEHQELINQFAALKKEGWEFEDVLEDIFENEDDFADESTIDELESYWDSPVIQPTARPGQVKIPTTNDKLLYNIPLEIEITDEMMPIINREPGDILIACKIGDAHNAQSRLSQHRGATTTHFGQGQVQYKYVLDIGNRRDYEIHEILKANPKIIWDGRKNEGIWNSREVFYMANPDDDISYIDEIVSKWVEGSKDFYKRDVTIEPYDRQKNIIDRAKKILKQRQRVLIEAAPRTGKSFMALTIAKEMGCKAVLILTPFPDADGSFRDIALFHKKFGGSNFRDAREMDRIAFDENYKEGGIQTIIMSWALLDDEKEKLQELFTQQIDMIIVDETHRQSDTTRSERLIESLSHTYEVHLSGTPYNDKLSGRFSEEDTITYDYIDRLQDAENAKIALKREADPAKRKKLEFLAAMPKLQFYLIDQMEAATEFYQQQYPDFTMEENLTLEKFFSPQMPDAAIKIFFRDLATTREDPLHPGLIDGDRAREFNHILAFVPSIEAADRIKRIMDELIREGEGWGGYYASSVSGIEENESYNNVEKYINDIQLRHGKTFTISVGKATTGVTLPKLSSVWILRRMKSAEQFVQIALRAGTAEKGKLSVNVTCFDSEMAIGAQAVIAQMRSQATGEKIDDIMKVLVKCLPTLVYDGKQFTSPLSTKEILDLSREILLHPLSQSDIELDEFSLLDLQALARLASLKSVEKYTKTLGLGGQAGGKNTKVVKGERDRKRPASELTPEDYKKIKIGILEVCKHFDWVVRRGIKTIRDLKSSPISLSTLGVSQAELDAIINVVSAERIQEILSKFEMRDHLFSITGRK